MTDPRWSGATFVIVSTWRGNWRAVLALRSERPCLTRCAGRGRFASAPACATRALDHLGWVDQALVRRSPFIPLGRAWARPTWERTRPPPAIKTSGAGGRQWRGCVLFGKECGFAPLQSALGRSIRACWRSMCSPTGLRLWASAQET